MVDALRPKPNARSIVEPQATARLLLLRNLQPFASPDAFHSILAHLPAIAIEQCRDAPIAVASILAGQYDYRFGQRVFVLAVYRLVALRAAWLIHQLARPTLAYAMLFTGMAYRTASSFRA